MRNLFYRIKRGGMHSLILSLMPAAAQHRAYRGHPFFFEETWKENGTSFGKAREKKKQWSRARGIGRARGLHTEGKGGVAHLRASPTYFISVIYAPLLQIATEHCINLLGPTFIRVDKQKITTSTTIWMGTATAPECGTRPAYHRSKQSQRQHPCQHQRRRTHRSNRVGSCHCIAFLNFSYWLLPRAGSWSSSWFYTQFDVALDVLRKILVIKILAWESSGRASVCPVSLHSWQCAEQNLHSRFGQVEIERVRHRQRWVAAVVRQRVWNHQWQKGSRHIKRPIREFQAVGHLAQLGQERKENEFQLQEFFGECKKQHQIEKALQRENQQN